MLGFLKKLFGVKPAEATAEAPYKVEAPALAAQDPLTGINIPAPAVAEPVAETKPAPKKKPAGKKPAGPKPANKKQNAPKQNAPKQGGAKKGGRKPKSKPQV